MRRNLREILTDLNIKEIDTRFDEATAAAIFYVWREVGADPVCAMNGLMARCRKDRHGRAYQNILWQSHLHINLLHIHLFKNLHYIFQYFFFK